MPRVALVYHVHRDMYVEELGRRGALAAWLLETLPLRHLYARHAVRDDLARRRARRSSSSASPSRHHVVYSGVEADAFQPRRAHAGPSLLYLGRLKRYKRLEILLDVLEGVPGAHLDIAGEGDHRRRSRRRSPRAASPSA